MKVDPFWLIQHRYFSRDLEVSIHPIGIGDESLSRSVLVPCGEECLQATALALSAVMFQCKCDKRFDKLAEATGPHAWSAREPCIGLGIEFTSLVGMTCPSELATWGDNAANLIA